MERLQATLLQGAGREKSYAGRPSLCGRGEAHHIVSISRSSRTFLRRFCGAYGTSFLPLPLAFRIRLREKRWCWLSLLLHLALLATLEAASQFGVPGHGNVTLPEEQETM